MHGYILIQKHKERPIKIGLMNGQDEFVEVLVFATKKDLMASIDIEDDEEVRKIEI